MTLTFLEVVLGIDNVIFISILSAKLPAHVIRPLARRAPTASLPIAMRTIALLPVDRMGRSGSPKESPLFHRFDRRNVGPMSGRDLILIGGGLFLLAKATLELHERLEGEEHQRGSGAAMSFVAVIGQIMMLDIVFSLDSH